MQPPIRIVCISDTHNTQPDLSDGDILIHAGDLTEYGHFDELRAQIDWLAAQPHPHKIVIAGNHDTLLDLEFLENCPWYKEAEKTSNDLHWPTNVHYLRDSSVTLAINTSDDTSSRHLKIFGSPWTPQYGVSAFQYPHSDESFWDHRIPTDTEIVITHGPPRLHLDKTGFHRTGCPFLGEEISRVRPRLHVFGHIHVGYGREDVVLDPMNRRYEEIVNFYSSSDWDFDGWRLLIEMAATVLFQRLVLMMVPWHGKGHDERLTTMVNASIVGGPKNEVRNTPLVIEI